MKTKTARTACHHGDFAFEGEEGLEVVELDFDFGGGHDGRNGSNRTRRVVNAGCTVFIESMGAIRSQVSMYMYK